MRAKRIPQAGVTAVPTRQRPKEADSGSAYCTGTSKGQSSHVLEETGYSVYVVCPIFSLENEIFGSFLRNEEM